MEPKDLVKNLQNKPYETRVKILWTTVVVAAVLLIVIWAVGLKSTISSLNGQNLITPGTAQNTSNSQNIQNLISIERVETAGNNFNVYFNLNNTTDDILNFSKASDITLIVNDQTFHPSQINDRQGKPFAQKILSFTQNFGILVFPALSGDSGQLTFDQMTFERSSDKPLKQTLNLDFKELEKTSNLRH